jgi:oligoendopeptidase F/TusA-related sulfurtransferase
MSMELLGAADLSDFYGKADARRSRVYALQDIISLFPWVAIIDAFQHELYSFPAHTAKDRKEIWLALQARFDSGVDWSGLEEARSYLWQKQLHLFEVPFYYIEYGIAQLGALQVYANANNGIQNLIKAECLGSSKPLPELFSAAGIKFDFSPKTMEPLAEMILEELNAMEKIGKIGVQTIDLTDEVCPMTFVKTKVALHELSKGDTLEVLLRGEEPLKNVPRALEQEGHKILYIFHLDNNIHKIIVEK